MSRFKKGDRVRIKPEEAIMKLKPRKSPGFYRWMKEFCGDVFQVGDISIQGFVWYKSYFWRDEWLELVPDPVKITVEIDPSNPKEAHKIAYDAVDAACKAYKNRRTGWTEDELKEAKELAEKLVFKLMIEGDEAHVEWGVIRKNGIPYAVKLMCHTSRRRYTATCTRNDPFNEIIGKCVCLCKATGTPIPEFIKK